MKKNIVPLLLGFILVLGFIFRLYRFDGPVADWHSWRQSDTAAVTRNFISHGFDLLHPTMSDISNVQSGLENPHGYFFTEFPLYNALAAGLFKFFGGFTIEEWSRLVSIFSSLFISLFLYLIVSKYSNKKIGLLAAFFYTFTPFNIYYGRTILADTSMSMAVLGGIYFFDRWIEEKSKIQFKIQNGLLYLLAIIFTAVAFLLKPYALFFVLPIAYLAFKHFGWGAFKKWQLWLFVIVTLAPLVWWRIWMTQYPEGIPANAWLFNGNGIRFRPAFFRWIVYERLTVLISGYFGMVFGLVGIYKLRQLKNWLFFATFLVSSLAYVCVIATGNVQHDYYQILIMPSVAIIFAVGGYYLYSWKFKQFPVGIILFCLVAVCGFYYSWHVVRDYFNINNRAIVTAGEAVDKLTPKDALVIADYLGDTSFLYQMKRSGWASIEKPLPEMIAMGADYWIIPNPKAGDQKLGKQYKIVAQTKDYIILDLKAKP